MNDQIATVIRVVDGDTLQARIDYEFFDTNLWTEITVRINKIDAPETKGIESKYGAVSKEWLKKRIEGRKVTLKNITKEKAYKRWLCDIDLNGVDIGQEMLDQGLAEIYSPENHNNGKRD